jgi:phosphoadenylyl-sulfate reductase (thioredoxin)
MTIDLAELAQRFEGRPPEEILADAAQRFPGKITFGTGFGAEGCTVIDMIGRHGLQIDVFTLDTGVLFGETYDLWHRLEDRYGLKIRALRPRQTIAEQAATEGPRLWERDPDRCCELRKLQPQRAEMEHFDAWISALRREQTTNRAHAQVYESDLRFGKIKVNPLVGWTNKDVWNYIVRYSVPYNPLHDRGYPSIGCEPCTTAVKPGEDPRAGRWRGKEKTECGLHVPAGETTNVPLTQLAASR